MLTGTYRAQVPAAAACFRNYGRPFELPFPKSRNASATACLHSVLEGGLSGASRRLQGLLLCPFSRTTLKTPAQEVEGYDKTKSAIFTSGPRSCCPTPLFASCSRRGSPRGGETVTLRAAQRLSMRAGWPRCRSAALAEHRRRPPRSWTWLINSRPATNPTDCDCTPSGWAKPKGQTDLIVRSSVSCLPGHQATDRPPPWLASRPRRGPRPLREALSLGKTTGDRTQRRPLLLGSAI